jgi:hypothetical protein
MKLIYCVSILIYFLINLLCANFAHPSKLQFVAQTVSADKHSEDDFTAKRRKQFANFLSGGLAGTISSTLTAPLEVFMFRIII